MDAVLDRMSMTGPQLTRRDVMELATMHDEVSILFTGESARTAWSDCVCPIRPSGSEPRAPEGRAACCDCEWQSFSARLHVDVCQRDRLVNHISL